MRAHHLKGYTNGSLNFYHRGFEKKIARDDLWRSDKRSHQALMPWSWPGNRASTA
jgi:hypothetical protein